MSRASKISGFSYGTHLNKFKNRSKGNIPLLFKYTNKIHLTSKRISAIYKYINGNIYYANGTEVSRMKLHKTKIPTSSEPFTRQRTFCFGWCKQRSNPKEGKRGERGNPQRSNHNGKPAQRGQAFKQRDTKPRRVR